MVQTTGCCLRNSNGVPTQAHHDDLCAPTHASLSGISFPMALFVRTASRRVQPVTLKQE